MTLYLIITKIVIILWHLWNHIHKKITHLGFDRINTTAIHIDYIVNVTHDIYKDCVTEKINNKLLPKTLEEWELKMGDMIYLDIILKKYPRYVGYNDWILLCVSYTKQKVIFYEYKRSMNGRCHPFTK